MGEIEDFIREAARRRAARANAPSAPPRRPPQRTPPARPPVAEVVMLGPEDVVEAEAVSGDDVADYVRQHLDTSSFTQRASHLGEKVDQADDDLEARLHAKFDQKLSRLERRSTLEESKPDTVTVPTNELTLGIVNLFRSPQTLAQAVLMREILDRPEHRW